MSEEYKTIKYNGTEVRCYKEGYIALYHEKSGSRPAGWFKTFGNISDRGYMRLRIGPSIVGVHKLINLAFNKDTYKDGLVTDHINRITSDNRAENLRWVTLSDNTKNSDYQDDLIMHRKGGKNITVLKPNGKTSSRMVSNEDYENMKDLKMNERYDYLVAHQIKRLH